MRKRLVAILLAVLVATPTALVQAPANSSPAESYSGPYFGADNFPPGCIRDMSVENPDNICHHMRTGLNALDSPKVDVLVMVPVSPTAERDMRIMRQAVEMWENGIDYLARQMELNWLAKGMDFHLTVDFFDPAGDNGGEFTTYPLVDPEIVVIATNPVGGIGIGIDPVDFTFTDENLVPCHTIQNPFDFEYWENLPGFDNHHGGRTGTYNEDCGGAGGNICFAINGAIDPAPDSVDFFQLFDLVAHEFGHCLTIGHVGDGAEGEWAVTPRDDIMAYHEDPPGISKCVSTLDVEGVAIRMSRYLDVDGDGRVGDDVLEANDQIGQGGNPFQVQHPGDHLYASATGSPLDCPQPDIGLIPGERTNWTPMPASTSSPVLTVTSPEDGTVSNDGRFHVTGTVERKPFDEPTDGSGSYDDADDDASSPVTEILGLDVAVTPTHLDATMSMAELWPSLAVTGPTTYSLTVNGRQFDSFVRKANDPNPMTWDNGASAYLPTGSSTWDLDAKTVTFHLPRDYLALARIESPYTVISRATFGVLVATAADDSAPEAGRSVLVGSSRVIELPQRLTESADVVTFESDDGNTFYPEESSLNVRPFPGEASAADEFTLDVPQTSAVEFNLSWTDDVGGADLDLYVTGAADSGDAGATIEHPETFVLNDVKGTLDIRVEPYFVTDVVNGSTYTLTATITPNSPPSDTDGDGVIDAEDPCPSEPGPAGGCPDGDGDGVADGDDVCPDRAGNGADGCLVRTTERVLLFVDGVQVASQFVETANGADRFDVPVDLAEGTHELKIKWKEDRELLAAHTLTVTHNTDDDGDGVKNADDKCAGFDDHADLDGDGLANGCDKDRDGDGVNNGRDNCADKPNPDQANMDRDGKGDVCDPDIDGDGHSNQKEKTHGTNPKDRNSFPR